VKTATNNPSWGNPSPKGWDFICNSGARINIAEGSVRSGKTVSSILRWIEYVATAPPGDLLMTGKTLRSLSRNILRPIQQFLNDKNFSLSLGAGECHILGRLCYLVGANDERAEGKIRGMTVAGICGDELTLWPQSFFSMAMTRMSVPGACFFGTTNPDSPFHWLKTDYLDNETLNDRGTIKSWHFELSDNPYLTSEYIQALKDENQGLWRKRFIDGLWVLADGAIYDMFDDDIHVYEGNPPFEVKEKIASIDYGTANPCTFGVYGLSRGSTQRIALMKEYWWDSKLKGRQKTDDEYARDYLEFIKDEGVVKTYVDPSATSFIAALRNEGVLVFNANNSVLDGIKFVSEYLAKRLFFVCSSCVNTIKEFGSYIWDPKAAKRGEDSPLKENDHGMDRDRYALFTHLGPPLASYGAW
jgi:PBSX family phage terminase large subunit